jgi:hypothetical protein
MRPTLDLNAALYFRGLVATASSMLGDVIGMVVPVQPNCLRRMPQAVSVVLRHTCFGTAKDFFRTSQLSGNSLPHKKKFDGIKFADFLMRILEFVAGRREH